MSDVYVTSELDLRNYLLQFACDEKLYDWFNYIDLMKYRFPVPIGRGNHTLNIFQKLNSSVILYCDFLCEEGYFECKFKIISSTRKEKQYRLIKRDFEYFPWVINPTVVNAAAAVELPPVGLNSVAATTTDTIVLFAIEENNNEEAIRVLDSFEGT